MCCAFEIVLPDAVVRKYGDAPIVGEQLWGRPDFSYPEGESPGLCIWEHPFRYCVGSSLRFKVSADGHDEDHGIDPDDWLRTMKYAVGAYEELRRLGISSTLSQLGKPCHVGVIAEDGGDPDLTRLCRAALEGRESAPDDRERP